MDKRRGESLRLVRLTMGHDAPERNFTGFRLASKGSAP